jgi:hypothetical protein
LTFWDVDKSGRVLKLANPGDFQPNMTIWGLILILIHVPKFCGVLFDASRETAILWIWALVNRF